MHLNVNGSNIIHISNPETYELVNNISSFIISAGQPLPTYILQCPNKTDIIYNSRSNEISLTEREYYFVSENECESWRCPWVDSVWAF